MTRAEREIALRDLWEFWLEDEPDEPCEDFLRDRLATRTPTELRALGAGVGLFAELVREALDRTKEDVP